MASFDDRSSGGGGGEDLPLEHSVFTLEDGVSWGSSDRRNGHHQSGGQRRT